MPHDAFISHASKDKLVADMVVARLEAAGIRCWVAPRDIAAGASWAGSIVEAINQSKLFVVIFSSHANASDHVRREVERAVAHGAIVVPLRIEDVLPGGDLEYFLSASHWMDAITPPMEQHLDALAGRLNALLTRDIVAGKTPVAGLSAVSPVPKPHRWSLTKRLWVAAMVLPVLFVSYVFWPSRTVPSIAASQPSTPIAPISTGSMTPTAPATPAPAAVSKSTPPSSETFQPAAKGPSGDPQAIFDSYLKGAKGGDTEAMIDVGILYVRGVGVARDPAAAMGWFRKAADVGSGRACGWIGSIYSNGFGVPRDSVEAHHWFLKGSDARDPASMGQVGMDYLRGTGVATDKTRGADWIERAAAMAITKNDNEALAASGIAYAYYVEDNAKVRSWMKRAADAGDATAKQWLRDHE